MPIHELIICYTSYPQQTSATPQRAPELISVQCIGIKTNIKPRHDVIYVDKLTYCIQGTYWSIRWWSPNHVKECYLSASIKDWSHSQSFPLAFTITASISLGENIFPSLRSLIAIFRSDIYAT